MESNNGGDKLDYQMLLMNHLNRLSMVSTSPAIEMTPQNSVYANPLTNGQMALNWGTKFLQSIIPTDMRDLEYIQKEKDISQRYEAAIREYNTREEGHKINEEVTALRWNQLKNAINLLHRKGMLLNSRIGGKREGRGKPSNKKDTQEVFEE